MGSVIDKVQELAPAMGVFTTRQMAFKVFGELTDSGISSVGSKLRSLARQGYIVSLGNVRDNGYHQATWRAVP